MLHGRFHQTLVPALLVALLGALLIAPAADAARGQFGVSKKVRVVHAENVRGGVATFALRGRGATKCRAARFRVGSKTRNVAAELVRTAARRHTMRVRLRRAERREAKQATPRLVIYRASRKSSPKKTQPAPAPPSEPTTTEPVPSDPVAQPTDGTTSPPATTQPEVSAPGPLSTTRPAGSPVLTDAEAAARVRPSGTEKRPVNAIANQRIPTDAELSSFRAGNSSLYEPHERLVTGAFRGTTDEIIQWAAWKWGIDEDVFRAQAAVETWWSANFIGDNGQSFGLFQIKRTVHLGTYPLSVDSTAFNADYTGALFRYYYDGHATWLNNVEQGKPYTSGDMWGSLGAHYAGRWWTTGAQSYIDDVKRRLAARVWEQAGF